MPLPAYLKEKPYPNPELLVFELTLLEGFINGEKVNNGGNAE